MIDVSIQIISNLSYNQQIGYSLLCFIIIAFLIHLFVKKSVKEPSNTCDKCGNNNLITNKQSLRLNCCSNCANLSIP
jgi:hypothetical protein